MRQCLLHGIHLSVLLLLGEAGEREEDDRCLCQICVKFIMKLITDYVYTSGAHIELHQTNKKNVLSYSTVSFVVCI